VGTIKLARLLIESFLGVTANFGDRHVKSKI
jgi:hypothetical protein